MPYITLSSGLTLSVPTAGTNNYADALKTGAWQKISEHDHTGGGKGLQIGAGAIAANAITETAIRFANNSYIRTRNAANSADLNLLKANASDLAEFGIRLAAFTLTNNTYISGRNAAGSADVSMIKINASDQVEFGTTVKAFTLATPLTVANGGTGTTGTPSNGQLHIGNGSGFALATITGTSNQLTVTNGSGTITLSTPQDIHTAATPTFSSLTLSSGSVSITGSSVLNLRATTDLYLGNNGANKILLTSNDFRPVSDLGANLGSASFAFNGLSVQRIDYRGTHGTSSKNPAVDSASAWIEVQKAGVTYYMPLYVA